MCKILLSSLAAIAGLLALATAKTGQAARYGSTKGVILKITDAGDAFGNTIPNPLTNNPAAVVTKLNAEGVGEVRVQVNDGLDDDSVTMSGASVANTLANLGYQGQAILDNKKWNLNESAQHTAWANMMYTSYQKMNALGKSIIGGYSLGETTPSVLSWNNYSVGVVLAVNELQSRFLNDTDATNDQALAGMKFFVGGASYNSSFKNLTPTQHAAMKSAIEATGATLIYSYKSFHSLQGQPQPDADDELTVGDSMNWLNTEVGLANLAAVAPDAQVQYRGDASDKITGNAIRKQAIINIFNQHDNFAHAGAEKVLGDLFDDAGTAQSGSWNRLNGFYNSIRQSPDSYSGLPASMTMSVQVNTDTTNRPFFSAGGPSGFAGSIVSNAAGSTTVRRERITIVGNATEANRFRDGNGLPTGVAVAFDASFTVAAANGTLTDGGSNGLAINSAAGAGDRLDTGEQLHFSSITLTNVVFRDPRNLLKDGAVQALSPKWSILRSNDFSESTAGAIVSADAAGLVNPTSFGMAGSGSINNNYVDGAFAPLTEAYLTTTAGSWRLKGIEFTVDFGLTLYLNAGDFNADGLVDAADYVVWRDAAGQSGANLAADANNDGVVNDADYSAWRADFLTANNSSATATSVPEPYSWLVVFGCVAAILQCRTVNPPPLER